MQERKMMEEAYLAAKVCCHHLFLLDQPLCICQIHLYVICTFMYNIDIQ